MGMSDDRPLSEFATEQSLREEVERVRRLAASHAAALNTARSEARKLENDLAAAQARLNRYASVKPVDTQVPKWVAEEDATGAHRAIPVLLLSDLHLDEVVDPYEMGGINEYDRDIAERRFSNIINGTEKLLKRFVNGVGYDGIVVPFLGDTVTGVIHEELARTNVAPVPQTIAYWVPILASGIQYLADTFDVPVHVPCVDGNHDRTYVKIPAKQRATSSFAWIIYNWLADLLRDDDRISFSITPAPDQVVPVYSTRFLLNHGDEFRSAGGVGGLYPSMLKWLLRKHQLWSMTDEDFDYAVIGHWHQPLWGQDFIVNGSLKGYDEYAKKNGFVYNAPSQQLFVVTPERGITQRLEVYAD